MVTSDFPNGVTSWGIPAIGNGEIPLAGAEGQYFYVDSNNGSDGNDGSRDAPLATVDAAVNKCTDSKGDVIVVEPGHAETISAASGIDLDVIGVRVACLGEGAERPTFTFSATDATITIAAASCEILGYPLIVPSIDSVVSPIVISAADCRADIEVKDASDSVECVRAVLTTAGADRLTLNIRYLGRTGGNACVNMVRLVGVDGARINLDGYGIFSTTAVEFHTTACTDIIVTGYVYNSGTTDGSKLVIDTVTGSTWYAEIQDGAAGAKFSGGSGGALAADDVGAVSSLIGTVNSTTTDNLHGKIGTDTEMADRSVFDLLAGDGPASYPAAAAPANDVSLAEIIRAIYDRQLGDGTDASTNAVLGKRVTKTAAGVATADDLFDVTGQCLVTLMYGVVTTLVAGGTLPELLVNVKDGSNTPISASTVITDDAVDTVYWVMGDPNVVFNGGDAPTVAFAGNGSASGRGFIIDDVTIESTPGGTAAATAGAITWTLFYLPLEDSASIAAAA